MVAPQDAPRPDDDPMGPPKTPVEVRCLHCVNIYMSDRIRWEPDPAYGDGGVWRCPVEGCDGVGFCFDIFPTDPEVAEQFGVHYFEDDDEDDYDSIEDFEEPDPPTNPPRTPPRIFDDDEELPF